jgi:Zn-dependent metalloprotease
MKKTKQTASTTITNEQFTPTVIAPSYRAAQMPSNIESPLNAFKSLKAPSKMTLSRDVELLRDATGDIIMLHGTRDLTKGKNRNAQQKAATYLEAIQGDLGFRQINDNFELKSSEIDEIGQEHIRMNQVHKGVRVYGAEIILHSNEGELGLLNGRFYPTPDILNVNPSLSINNAKKIIENDLSQKGVEFVESHFVKEKFKSELVIYHKNRDKNAEKLAYHVTILPNAMARYEYFVDAQTGDIIHHFDHTCNFVGHHNCNHQAAQPENEQEIMDGSADASAADLFGVKRDLKAYLSAGSYYMIDVSRPMYKPSQSKMPDDPIGAIWTLDAGNTSPELSSFNYDHVTSLDNKWTNKTTAISAHYNAGLAYDYFKKVFGRESINGNGGTIISLINIVDKNKKSMENAFWNGEAMFYGNGGSAFLPLARGLDVAGHEMSHGVIQNTANLEYENESGAMNESFADIFGAMIDRDDWKVGEDVVKTAVFPTGALRDLSNPNNGGKSLNDNGWQPKSMSEKYTGSQDNGGVHINSGITNFAFYKYATAIGKDKAEKVFYRALTKYLVKSSQFLDLRAAVQQSATDLYGAGTTEVNEVANAFTAVGIGTGGNTTGSNYQKDVKVNPGTDLIAFTDQPLSNISLFIPSTKKTSSISTTALNSRPSVTDDGSFMVFVAADKSIHGIDFDWAKGTVNEQIISTDKVWKNAVISKDGNRLAAVLDKNDNQVYVFDFTKNPVASKAYTLSNPTYTQGVATADVQYADGLEFDVTGDNLMYDAYNILKGTKGAIEYWDIGFLRVYNSKTKTFGDGKIQKLFTDLQEGTSVANPIFSKNSPHIIAFDYGEAFDQDKYYILTANIQTGEVGEIYYNGIGSSGYPCFSRLDDKLVFETRDQFGNYAGSIDLSADKLSPKTPNTSAAEVIDKGYWPLWFSNGKRVLVGTNDLAKDIFNAYPNPFKESINLVFTSVSQKNYQIFDLTGKTMLSGSTDNQELTLDLDFLPQGTYILKAGGGVQKIVKF